MKGVPAPLFDPNKPLNFHVVVLNHLMVFSQSLAYRQCDYEEMVRTFEGLVTPIMSHTERQVLRKYKLIMAELHDYLLYFYKEKKRKCSDEEELKRVEKEEEDDLYRFRTAYYNLLFKWLVYCGCRIQSGKSDSYTQEEFFEDLRIELQSIFTSKVVQEVINRYVSGH
jgi:hypothetical protein